MNTATQIGMPFAMTIGAGRKNPQGQYYPVKNTVEAVAEAIRAQPDGLENWFSLHLWHKNYRTEDNWLASSGIVIDVDYDVAKTAPPQNLVNQLLSLATDADLPGSIFYLTPHGCRVIWVYEKPCSEREIQRKAELAAGAQLAAVIPAGYHVDEPLLGELARFFYTPNCTAKDVKRSAEVIVMRQEIVDPYVLAATAPERKPAPKPAEPARAPISLDLASATARWNESHPEDYPKDSGDCPMCGHSGCFGRFPDDDSRWFCWSTDHSGGGIQSARGWHGDALDIEAHKRGIKPSDVLRADGYLVTKKQEASSTSTNDTSSAAEFKFTDLIELGEALTPELIALQKEPLPTGIPDVDLQLGGGYFCGELIVVQASTGVGKTSFNLFSQCAGVANDPQRPGLYITTEMQAHELQARRACQVLNEQGVICNWRQVLNGTVPLERTKAATANTRVHVLRMRPSETPTERIRKAALFLADKYGKPPFIVADYLQALSLGLKEERRIAVGTTIYAMQELAVELQTPVVAISSISRAGNAKERRESDDPMDFLNIAKEAGEIEFAASVLCHLDVKAQTDEQGWRAARFILAKTRFGCPGIMGMRFHGSSGRFEASRTSGLSEFELAVLTKVQSGTYSSANAVAKAMKKNRPKVLATVRSLQAVQLLETVAGYLRISPKFEAQLTDHLGGESSD